MHLEVRALLPLLILHPIWRQARAKVELREHVTEQDAKDVVDMMQEVRVQSTADLLFGVPISSFNRHCIFLRRFRTTTTFLWG